jgi:hypothetical protein
MGEPGHTRGGIRFPGGVIALCWLSHPPWAHYLDHEWGAIWRQSQYAASAKYGLTIGKIDYLLLYFPLKSFSLIWRRHQYRWRAAKLRPMLGAQAFEHGRIFILPHLLWHMASVFLDRPIQSPLTTQGNVEDQFKPAALRVDRVRKMSNIWANERLDHCNGSRTCKTLTYNEIAEILVTSICLSVAYLESKTRDDPG